MQDNPLLYALFITVLGMVIVFVVLMLLQYIIKLMKVTVGGQSKSQYQPVVEVGEHHVNAILEREKTEAVDDSELIAVITAAVVASMGGNTNLVVRNIVRVGDASPAWAKTGRQEQMLQKALR